MLAQLLAAAFHLTNKYKPLFAPRTPYKRQKLKQQQQQRRQPHKRNNSNSNPPQEQ